MQLSSTRLSPMWRPYTSYLWPLALLLLHASPVRSLGTFYIDPSCPDKVQDAIHEAIIDLLPRVWTNKYDEHLSPVLSYIWPGMKFTTKQRLFRMVMIPRQPLLDQVLPANSSLKTKVISAPSAQMRRGLKTGRQGGSVYIR